MAHQKYNLKGTGYKTFYEVLGIQPTDDFNTIKQAYYRRAKECHPDKFGGNTRKEEDFKLLVQAFDTLSNPQERFIYDAFLEAQGLKSNHATNRTMSWEFIDHQPIMDTEADDILEELIVGNDIPRDTHISRIFADMQKTEKFIRFREGLSFFYAKNYYHAYFLFSKSVQESPYNILYHFYLGRTFEELGKKKEAIKEYQLCLQLGNRRDPPQQLFRIRRQLEHLLTKRKTSYHLEQPSDEQLVQAVTKTIFSLMIQKNTSSPLQLPGPPSVFRPRSLWRRFLEKWL